ncbi:MAG: hypothetical protein ACTHJ3_02710, partial [Pararhizobium sp.]
MKIFQCSAIVFLFAHWALEVIAAAFAALGCRLVRGFGAIMRRMAGATFVAVDALFPARPGRTPG